MLKYTYSPAYIIGRLMKVWCKSNFAVVKVECMVIFLFVKPPAPLSVYVYFEKHVTFRMIS